MITFLDGIKLLITMACIGILLEYVVGFYTLVNSTINKITNNDPKLYKNKYKLYKKYLFKFSTFKKYMCYSLTLTNEIINEVKKEVPIVKFSDSTTMTSFVLECLHKKDSVLVISNNYQMCKILSHRLRVLGNRKNIKLNNTTICDYKYTIQGIDYDYILWMDVIKQKYILYKKVNGKNVLNTII